MARLALVGLLLAGVATWYVASRGGWDNALGLPPVLDASTPTKQGGFALLSVQRPGNFQNRTGQDLFGFHYGDIAYQSSYGMTSVDRAEALGLWISPPSLSDNLKKSWRFYNAAQVGDLDSDRSTCAKAYSFSARLSTGDTFPLQWHLRGQEWPTSGGEGSRLLFVSLPAGYSDACNFVDVSATDLSGHSATWRITRLPRMRHAVPLPSSPTDTVTKDGITMSAQAWHMGSGPPDGEIAYVFHPILPPNSHQWDVLVTERSREWEPFGYDGAAGDAASLGDTYATPILGRNGVFNEGLERWYGGGILGFVSTDYYPRMTRSLRLACVLRQFDTYDEPVTFHNVAVQYDEDTYRLDHEKVYYLSLPQPLTVTTPSGISVTLPIQGGRFRPMLFGEGLSFLATVRPDIQEKPVTHPLPNSPLARTFGKPVKLSLTFPPPYRFGGGSSQAGDEPGDYAMSLPLNPAWQPARNGLSHVPIHQDLPPVLRDFTIIIRQRVDLQTIPMTFTLPIEEKSPPFYPKRHQPPKRP